MFFGCLHCVVQKKAVACGVNHSIWEPFKSVMLHFWSSILLMAKGNSRGWPENLNSYTQVGDLEEVSGSLAWPSSGFGALWGVNQ